MAEQAPQPWLDLDSGALLIGEAAVQRRFEEGAINLRPLGAVLLEKSLTYDELGFNRFKRFDVTDWTPEQAHQYGQWVTDVVRQHNPQANINQRMIRRLSVMGVGPSEEMLVRAAQVDTLSEYRQQAGLEPIHRGKFADWSIEDFYNYAEGVARPLGRKLVRQDLEDYARGRSDRPTMFMIERRVKIGELNEYLGYVDGHGWQQPELIHWGVDFMKANNGLVLTRRFIDHLSTRSKGPSEMSVRRHFKSIPEFNGQVVTAYYADQMALRDRLSTYQKLVADGELPERFARANQEALLRAGGLYQLAKRFLPDGSSYKQFVLRQSSFAIPYILERNPHVTAADIETTAVALGVFDDIWPMATKRANNFKVKDPQSICGAKSPTYFDMDDQIIELTTTGASPESLQQFSHAERLTLLARVIRHKRLLAGHKAVDVARRAYISIPYFYKLECVEPSDPKPAAGHYQPSPEILEAVANTLDLNLQTLLTLAGHAA